MTVSPGFTSVEIREFVHEYQLVPHGMKGGWLAERGVSRHRLQRWRETVFEGDLDRGLVPRQGSPVTTRSGERTALERQRAAERAASEVEVTRLTARVRELEDTNEALGKAIGLLHKLNEQEPARPVTTTDPSSS
jgi:hypothetical protein